MPVMTKEKPKKIAVPKWSMNQDDYIELLESIDTNAKAINNLIIRLGVEGMNVLIH